MARRGPVARGGELGGNQQRDHAAGRGELHRALEERDGQVRPVAESAPRASPPAIAALQPPARLRWHLLGAKPRRIPRDDVETAAGEYVGEMALIVEPRHLALADQRAARAPKGSELCPVVGEADADLGVGAAAPAEEILASRRAQAFRDARPRLRLGRLQRSLRRPALRRAEGAHQLALSLPAGGDELPPEVRDVLGQARIGSAQPYLSSDRLEQGVALANEAVEVGQRLHQLGSILPILGDHGQPEPELREPHRGGAAVDAEQRALKDAAAARRGGDAVGRREGGQPFERTQQERTRAGRRIEQR